MLNISNISIHFAGRYLFDSVSFTIRKNDRIGLTGRNGSGKTTLLKIITGLESPEEGSITKPNDFKIGYLPQDAVINSEKTIFDEASLALSELKELENRQDSIMKELESRSDYDSKDFQNLLHDLHNVNERFKILGGNSINAEIEQVLLGLGFTRDDFERPVNEFSGGWRMRIELAKILLAKPDLILLDEPTNHLDIESISWLEEFLKNYAGAIMLVSHDSRFLDSVSNRTIEIVSGNVYDLDLPYKQFLIAREQQKQQQLAAFRNQQRNIAQTERFIERFRSKATLASRVQSRIKQLEKIERIEVEEDDYSSIHFRFPEPPRSARVVAEVLNLTKNYGSLNVISNAHLAIERGEKAAFVGKNGEGKTTLTKILVGQEDYEGDVKIGENVIIGYYAQHQAEMLDGDSTVFETIDNVATGDMRTRVRSLLGAFLFSGESVHKKVKVLSGGEKSRLALAKLLLQPANFLILDEPTNHLDVVAKQVLKNALLDFQGAVILVSHDRDFLEGLTSKTFEFKNKTIREYPGSVDEYLAKQKLESLRELERKNLPASEVIHEKSTTQSAAKLSREAQKAQLREENRLRKQIQAVESEIGKLEERKSQLETIFSSPGFFEDYERSNSLNQEYKTINSEIELQMEHWSELHSRLEEMIKDWEKSMDLNMMD